MTATNSSAARWGSFIVAAVLTPTPDPWNQTIFAGPMVGLYLVSILIVWLVQPKRRKSNAGSAVDDSEAR